MTIGDINAYVSFRESTDTTQYSAANRLISTNRWMHKIWTMILSSVDGWDIDDFNQTNYPIATTPLVAGQRDYAFPTSLKALGIKRVDVTYDGVTYYKCEPWDSSETGLGLGSDTNTDARFSKNKPFYDIRANAIFLYPEASAADVSAGALLRIEYAREALEFSSGDVSTGTKVPGFDTPFHMMIALGMCYDWCVAKNLFNEATLIMNELNDYEVRLRTHYGIRDEDTKYMFQAAFVNYT